MFSLVLDPEVLRGTNRAPSDGPIYVWDWTDRGTFAHLSCSPSGLAFIFAFSEEPQGFLQLLKVN